MTDTFDKENHWYGWNGGECPVHEKTIVSVMLRNGTKSEMAASEWEWAHYYIGEDIIAFRITKLYREPRKPREFWYNCYGNALSGPYDTQEEAQSAAGSECTGRAFFREVLPEDEA